MKIFVTGALVLSSALCSLNLYAMDSSKDSNVTIVNESNWPIEVHFTKGEKALSLRVGANDSITLPGKANTLSKVAYGTYGTYFGSAFRGNYPINLEKAIAGQDLIVKISTWMQGWTEKYESVPKKKQAAPDDSVKRDPWDEFGSEARQSFIAGDMMKAYRRIFNLPITYTQDDLNAAYKQLAFAWHPDKHPTDVEYATSVTKIINDAHDILKK